MNQITLAYSTRMMTIWLEAVDPKNTVKKIKVTLVSPPWPGLGDELTYLGSEWIVIKMAQTYGALMTKGER